MNLRKIRNQFLLLGYNRILVDKVNELIETDPKAKNKPARVFVEFWSHRLTIPHDKPRDYDNDIKMNKNKVAVNKNATRIKKLIVDEIIEKAGIADIRNKEKWLEAAEDRKIAKVARLKQEAEDDGVRISRSPRSNISVMTPDELKEHRSILAKRRYDPAKQKLKTIKDRHLTKAYYEKNKVMILARAKINREAKLKDQVTET